MQSACRSSLSRITARLLPSQGGACHFCSAPPDDLEVVPEYSTPPLSRRMDFDHEILAKRGYLRNQAPYQPPRNVSQLVSQACKAVSGSVNPDLSTLQVKFNVLEACRKAFNHKVPNSKLHEIKSKEHLVVFYSEAVDTRVPLDQMKDIELPPNLHVSHEYLRFHPETDTAFGGITAFSGENNVVTGLKARKKHRGFEHKPEWLRYPANRPVDRWGNALDSHPWVQ